MSKKATRFIPHACALLISFFALQGSAAAQVTVFADINYSGSSQTFRATCPNLVDAGFNDAISSIRIPSGEQWQFCQDVNFQGDCQTLQGRIVTCATSATTIASRRCAGFAAASTQTAATATTGPARTRTEQPEGR